MAKKCYEPFDRIVRADSVKWIACVFFIVGLFLSGVQAAELDEIHFKKGNEYLKKGEYDLAIDQYTKAIELNPGRIDAYNNRAIVYFQGKGWYDQAISDFSKVLEIDPDNAYTYGNRGNVYRKRGDYDKAVSDYIKAIELNPKFALAHCGLGDVYLEKGLLDEAVAQYSKAIALRPTYARALYNRGLTYQRKKAYTLAIHDYRRTVEVNPNNASAYNNQAWILATSPHESDRQGVKAVELARRAVEISSEADHLDTLSAAYAEAGRFEDAIRTQEDAIKKLGEEGTEGEAAEYKERLASYKAHKPWREQ
jgi:tetratricopeptide (TPR) repeat protein